jgi:hypothetical protein
MDLLEEMYRNACADIMKDAALNALSVDQANIVSAVESSKISIDGILRTILEESHENSQPTT